MSSEFEDFPAENLLFLKVLINLSDSAELLGHTNVEPDRLWALIMKCSRGKTGEFARFSRQSGSNPQEFARNKNVPENN
jgi:hypothetical protein